MCEGVRWRSRPAVAERWRERVSRTLDQGDDIPGGLVAVVLIVGVGFTVGMNVSQGYTNAWWFEALVAVFAILFAYAWWLDGR